MIVAPASSPTPTPAPTLASVYGLGLQPRQTDYLDYDTSCYCTTMLDGCYGAFLSASDYDEAVSTCYCNYGISYLDCYYSQVATGICASYYFTGDTSWSSVSLALQTVDVVTATGALEQPDYNAQPLYQGTGELLQGCCSETGFTLVDAGNTVFYAGLMGCNMASHECCPWAVATATSSSAGAATDVAGVNVQDNVGYDFSQPANGNMAQLAKCADDYYSISGGCCPIGFWPFTEADVKTLDKPTSAVVNIVWSMRYTLEAGGGGLSTAAKAGIGAGAGVAAILVIGLAICLWRSRRKNKTLAVNQQPAAPDLTQLPQQQQLPFQQTQMTQQPPGLSGQLPYGAYPPGMVSPSTLSPPSDHTSVVTTMTPTLAAALIPQHTGASNGAVSQLSSQSGQGQLQNSQPGAYFAGAAAANPRVSSHGSSNSGTGSPATGAANGQGGYPAPIAEADEGQRHHHGQYQYHQQQWQQQQQCGYQHHQQQQKPQQFCDQGQGGGGYYHHAHPQGHPQQGGYAYSQHQQRQGYQTSVPEMSANREVDPPQEVMGSQVSHGMRRE
ncbi:hypothetical protein C8A03DRAFT_32427 [Achaetomium macrosporum]|uniref:Uncharacterized protein n=1 Tax=Achaetomium macrosporum TaxID=79813 RepID=A0AAN7CCK1_9PEZI|nr:hypothetical protein C8A03DRAFT_32427 [Achaetomium macrosporum]